jgi:hypothetical protein
MTVLEPGEPRRSGDARGTRTLSSPGAWVYTEEMVNRTAETRAARGRVRGNRQGSHNRPSLRDITFLARWTAS